MAEAGRVVQVSVSPAGGVPKQRVERARVTFAGVEGDRQRDLVHHGGPRRAVCLYSLERIEALQHEGHTIGPGSTGENLTIAGLDWDSLAPGDQLQVGADVQLEITQQVAPCLNIAASFRDGAFGRISALKHPGWARLYARVLAEGDVFEGAEVVVLSNMR